MATVLLFSRSSRRWHARKKWRTLQLDEGMGFSFACSNGTGNLSSSETTKLVSLVIKDVLLDLQQKDGGASSAQRGGGRVRVCRSVDVFVIFRRFPSSYGFFSCSLPACNSPHQEWIPAQLSAGCLSRSVCFTSTTKRSGRPASTPR